MRAAYTATNRNDSGATLVELMVTLAVMTIAAVIISSTLILVQRATNKIEKSSQAIDSARVVSEGLDRELRSADCVDLPSVAAPTGNTLQFITTIGGSTVWLRYTVQYGTATLPGTVTRSLAATRAAVVAAAASVPAPQPIISLVGPTSAIPAFTRNTIPLTVEVDIPIRSENGGVFHLLTTNEGRTPCPA